MQSLTEVYNLMTLNKSVKCIFSSNKIKKKIDFFSLWGKFENKEVLQLLRIMKTRNATNKSEKTTLI